MKKINLLVSKSNSTSFHDFIFQQTINEYFNVLYIEDNPLTNIQDTLLVAGPMGNTDWYNHLHQQGYKLLIDQLWGQWKIEKENCFLLHADHWFWYISNIRYRANGYQNYIPNRTYTKLAFMPMGTVREERTKLYNKVEKYLDNFIWSYVGLTGKMLPDDPSYYNDVFHFNSSWYDHTYFSLISETSFLRLDGPDKLVPNFLLSEKIFKPMAFRHPFIVWGQPKVLAKLHELGFETYDNLFDESYDLEENDNIRLNKLVANISTIKNVAYDKLTLDKIQHNYEIFYNEEFVMQQIKKEIIIPILNFFEK